MSEVRFEIKNGKLYKTVELDQSDPDVAAEYLRWQMSRPKTRNTKKEKKDKK